MDALAQAALVGTARTGGAPLPDTPTSGLVAHSEHNGPEQTLLLRGGADAVYRLAGAEATRIPAVTEAAAPESLPACTPRATSLIGEVFRHPAQRLFPEAAARLAQCGQRLPPALLPLILGTEISCHRQAVLPILGARGRWLARQNPAWQWVDQMFTPDTPIPADAERRWREGTPGERLALLSLLRSRDPATARAWLLTDWKSENPEWRTRALRRFVDGLSPEDIPFLESIHTDRTMAVRNLVVAYLARLDHPETVRRVIARAEPLLAYDPALFAPDEASTTGIETLHVGAIRPTLPMHFDSAWRRDGIEERPSDVRGKRGWWFTQIVALVPPMHWCERFGFTPEMLAAAAGHNADWYGLILDAWKRAAIAYGDAAWAKALWQWELATGHVRKTRAANPRRYGDDHVSYDGWNAELGKIMALPEAERVTIAHLRAVPIHDRRWELAIARLSPGYGQQYWSEAFGICFLAALETTLATSPLRDTSNRRWFRILYPSGACLPPACFARALQEWPNPEIADGDKRDYADWNDSVAAFKEIVRLRQRIYEEITP